MKFKFFIIIQILLFFYIKPNKQVDPFSEIKITSKRAVCQKDKNNKALFDFTYIDDVLVIFADKSSARSEKLSIKINTNKVNQSKIKSNTVNNESPNNLGNIKKITLSKNIFLKSENRNIKSDKAKIYPETKICKLSGNIRIEQTKQNKKDIPIITECQNAILDLVTKQISFLGNKNNPVSTIIKLESHPVSKKVKS